MIEIISIGNELLLGITVNTNAAFISRELTQRGFSIHRHTVMPDDKKTIHKEFQAALLRSSAVIATGGLGPTIDDMTKEAAETLFLNEKKKLKNSIGEASGSFYFSSGKSLVLLPGVPREMEQMLLKEALPLLEKHFPPKKQYKHIFSLCLFKEVEIDPYLRDLKKEHPQIESGIYPSRGTLQVVLSSDHPLEAPAKKFETKFPTHVFYERKIEEAVHRELISAKKTLGLAESCTGGAIAARLTAIPDASYFLEGSVVSYSNAWKEHFLHVSPQTISSHGAVSAETVAEMLKGIFSESDVDFAIAVSGIAGPSGGTVHKPVGTIYIGVGRRGERNDIGVIHAPQDRASAIDLAVQTSLCALWRRIVHNTPTFS